MKKIFLIMITLLTLFIASNLFALSKQELEPFIGKYVVVGLYNSAGKIDKIGLEGYVEDIRYITNKKGKTYPYLVLYSIVEMESKEVHLIDIFYVAYIKEQGK